MQNRGQHEFCARHCKALPAPIIATQKSWRNHNKRMGKRASKHAKEGSVPGRTKRSRPTNEPDMMDVDTELSVDDLFNEICDPDETSIIGMDGISELCDSVFQISFLEDARALIFLWKLGATSEPGQIAKSEWTKGCEKLEVKSREDLEALLPQLEIGLLSNEKFREFYKFCFQFNREGTHKTLDKELVTLLLQVILKDANRFSAERLSSFVSFLEEIDDYQRIALDQWMSFWDFSLEVKNCLSDYDEDTSAWPVLIDDYVEFMVNHQKK